jgi:hypothetical protein
VSTAVLDLAGRDALRSLAAAYARGVDRRDRGLFLSAFHPEATLEVRGVVMTGHDQIGTVIERIARYARTFHMLGQSAYEPAAGGEATGEVYCVAHHWTPGKGDYIMYVRYGDRYASHDGRWLIATRRVLIEATETRAASIAGQ